MLISVIPTNKNSELSPLITRVISNLHSLQNPKTQQSIVIEKIIKEWQSSGEWIILDDNSLPNEFDRLLPPDIVARFHNGHPMAIAEVETAFTLFAGDTFTRWSSLGIIAPTTFYIFVPKGYDKVCRRLLSQQGISATLGTYSFDEHLVPLIEPSPY